MIMKYLVIFLVGCSGAFAAPPPCAIPATRDGPGILAARDTVGPAGKVCLDSGEYVVVTPRSPLGARRPYPVLEFGATELFGAGADLTVVHFTGDAGGIDWHGVTKTGGDVHGFTIETSALTGTVEQTHAMRVFGPASNGRIYDMAFDHVDRGLPGGDCIQFVCYADRPCANWQVDHNAFRGCDRSGVAAHSGVTDLRITDNVFSDTGDQDIDGEGSGANFDWLIARNTFATGPHAQGDVAIQLQLADRVRITDNKFYGRGLFSYSSSHVEVDHNDMVQDRAGGTSNVEIKKASSYTNVHDNRLVRSAKAGPGALVRAIPHNSGTPDHLTVSGNAMAQMGPGDLIVTVGVVGLTVEGNTIVYSGPPGAGYAVLALGTTAVRTDEIELTGNTLVGQLAGCLVVSGAYGGTKAVTARGNVAMGPVSGLLCDNANIAQRITGPLTLAGNTWPAPSGCAGVPMP